LLIQGNYSNFYNPKAVCWVGKITLDSWRRWTMTTNIHT
jgi:hypothetical protein